jgi:hypothetical protein
MDTVMVVVVVEVEDCFSGRFGAFHKSSVFTVRVHKFAPNQCVYEYMAARRYLHIVHRTVFAYYLFSLLHLTATFSQTYGAIVGWRDST